ncbi:unnamed protein product [Linum trigynum]|uniref:Uncharacterized protein n=1 Tax=Linum trigynum TaxID=586398 RepID=A0AAV2FV86_9ROSI
MSDLLPQKAFHGLVVLPSGWRVMNNPASEGILWSHSEFEVAFYEPSLTSRGINLHAKAGGKRRVSSCVGALLRSCSAFGVACYEHLMPRKAFHGWFVLPSRWRV